MENLEIAVIVLLCLVILISCVFGIKIASMDAQIEELKNKLKNKENKGEQ